MRHDILNAIFQMVDLKKRTPSAQRKQLMEMFNLSEYEINQYIRLARQQMNISLRSQEEKQDWIIANIDLSKTTSQSDIELVAHMCGIQRNTAITYIANARARIGISIVQETKEIYDIIQGLDLSKPVPEKDKQELAEKFNTHPDNIDYFIANSRAKLGISFRQDNKEKEETFMLKTFGRNFKRTFTKTDITRIAKALGIEILPLLKLWCVVIVTECSLKKNNALHLNKLKTKNLNKFQLGEKMDCLGLILVPNSTKIHSN